MHVLYLKAAHSKSDIPAALRDLGHTVDVIENYEFDITPSAPEAYECVSAHLDKGSYDFVISYLFFGEISDLCLARDIPYLSWVYDSPLINLYDDAVHNPNNYIFVFDKAEFEHLKPFGLPHLYHLPLGTNIARTGQLVLTEADAAAFASEISFVGHLYEDNNYNKLIHYMPEYPALTVKTALMKGLCNWNSPKEWPYVSDEVLDFFRNKTVYTKKDSRNMDPKLYLGLALLTRKLAEMDRLTVLNALSEHYPVDLYSPTQSPYLGSNIRLHPSVEYYTDMNKVFAFSKINLNITLPSIESGLPQRIYDILGVGGFCLTNYQPEIEDQFVIGKEIEVFHDLPECIEKADYYLTHEKERQQIAISGYLKVRECFTTQHRLQTMLDIVYHKDAV